MPPSRNHFDLVAHIYVEYPEYRHELTDMLKKIQKWIGEHLGAKAPQDVRAHFVLTLPRLPVGHLTLNSGKWRFCYDEKFKKADSLRPLLEFPDVDRVYTSDELWPFFFMRIPSLKQTSVEDILKDEKIDKKDEVWLLKRFGRKTVANPFELIVVDDSLADISNCSKTTATARFF